MRQDRWVNSTSFNPDGKRVVTTPKDGTVHAWQNSWSMIASTEVLITSSCGRMHVELRRITADDMGLAKAIA